MPRPARVAPGNRAARRRVQADMTPISTSAPRAGRWLAGLGLCLCLAAAGCAQPGANHAQQVGAPGAGTANPATSATAGPPVSTPQPASTAPATPPASTVNPPDDKTPPPASDHPGDVVLAGTIVQGAEPGCTILTAAKLQYELMGPLVTPLRAGTSVTVTGHVQHGVMSHCMQGEPFLVSSRQVNS